jgi:RNA polymerase sigma-70 factor (ECF subfamily)
MPERDAIPDFETLHREYRPKILRYMTRYVGAEDAEELTQEIFLKISKSLKQFRGEAGLSTWIYRIATNTAVDRLRSAAHRADRAAAEAPENEALGPSPVAPDRADRKLVRTEMTECIQDVIDGLPEDYGAVLALSELEGFTNREIAEILQITLSNVKIRLHRGRLRLKEALESRCILYRNERNELACDEKPSCRPSEDQT